MCCCPWLGKVSTLAVASGPIGIPPVPLLAELLLLRPGNTRIATRAMAKISRIPPRSRIGGMPPSGGGGGALEGRRPAAEALLAEGGLRAGVEVLDPVFGVEILLLP